MNLFSAESKQTSNPKDRRMAGLDREEEDTFITLLLRARDLTGAAHSIQELFPAPSESERAAVTAGKQVGGGRRGWTAASKCIAQR